MNNKMFLFTLVIATVFLKNVQSLVVANQTDLEADALSSRIVGGEKATIESYPYQVSLQKNGKHNCGGIILSANYVLTAAHCVPRTILASYTVRAGSSYHDDGGCIHKVDKIIRNEDAKVSEGKIVGDLAMLHLANPLKLDAARKAIPLFAVTEKVKDNQKTVVTGWGSTTISGGPFSKQLQMVSLPIVNRKICTEAYKGKVTDGQICAGFFGKGGKDTCTGDSGGPLTVDGRLAGVTSWGLGCGNPKYPGVYVEVAYYRDWIDKQLKAKADF